MLDLLIRRATIYDGGGGEPFIGDVGVRKDKIVAIGNLAQSAQTIVEAQGLILCPGFVDIHSHSDYFLLIE